MSNSSTVSNVPAAGDKTQAGLFNEVTEQVLALAQRQDAAALERLVQGYLKSDAPEINRHLLAGLMDFLSQKYPEAFEKFQEAQKLMSAEQTPAPQSHYTEVYLRCQQMLPKSRRPVLVQGQAFFEKNMESLSRIDPELAEEIRAAVWPADYVLVEVSDTGTGIPLDIQDKIFEPFFSTKDIGKGTGLGLSTVYGIVKQTGGFVYVDSEPGRGTAFRVYLPRHVPGAEAEDNTAAPAPAKSVAADLTGQGTILLVDDEDSLRSLNARGLRSRGYTVVEACNGVEAIEMFDEHQGAVDLIVSDVVMPEMDGPTLLKALRERKPGIKMILVSGYAEDAFEKSLPEGEQFVFLPKPFTLSQLVASVKETLAKA